jgi:hypothetical protein
MRYPAGVTICLATSRQRLFSSKLIISMDQSRSVSSGDAERIGKALRCALLPHGFRAIQIRQGALIIRL